MKKRTVMIGAAAAALGPGDESEGTSMGAAAEKARAAALAITAGGTANAVERDSENGGTWEVEITKPDGNTVDVRLDESYGKVAVESHSEREDGGD